jgi:ribokinase
MTIREIAALADVSISTVSKIMNGKDEHINAETRARVLKIVKEYNYSPYSTIRGASNLKSFVLGFLSKNIAASSPILSGVIDTAREAGYSVLVLDSNNSCEQELKNITSLCSNGVDGLLWEPVESKSLTFQHYVAESNLPVCMLNLNSLDFPPDFKACQIDYRQLGYALTEELLQHKHTNVACMVKGQSLRSALVFDGFRKCLLDRGIPCTDDRKLDVDTASIFPLVLNRHFTGIVSSHFSYALKFYESALHMHYGIPADFSLVSLCAEKNEYSSYPPISTVLVPYREFGAKLCELLIRQCENHAAPVDFLFSPQVKMNHENSIQPPASLMPKKLVVVGSLNVDITLNVNELPRTGKTTTIRSSSITPGGKGTNQAIGAAKLGREVVLLGKIGDDYEASLIYDVLKKEHVRSEGVNRAARSQTGRAYIYVYQNSESSIAILPGANQYLLPADIDRQRDIFQRAGYCLISTEIPMETAVRAARVAHENGVKTILKPAASNALPAELYTLTDILVPNRIEASVLCPGEADAEKQAEYFLGKGCGTVIITQGHKGCYLRSKTKARYYPAAEFPSVDSTGGADAFIAALAAYLDIDCPMDKAIQIATYAAGFCISRQGVVPALIDKTSLENHIRMKQPELLLF